MAGAVAIVADRRPVLVLSRLLGEAAPPVTDRATVAAEHRPLPYLLVLGRRYLDNMFVLAHPLKFKI